MTITRTWVVSAVLIISLVFSLMAYSPSTPLEATAQEESDNTNAFIIALAAAGFAVLAGLIAAQAAQEAVTPSFGGRVATTLPVCKTPPGTLTYLAGPKPYPLMVIPGAVTYPNGPPVVPGQNTLGRAGVAPVPCIEYVPCPAGACPVFVGAGLPVIMSGTSIPGS